jgi:hypothetical protein
VIFLLTTAVNAVVLVLGGLGVGIGLGGAGTPGWYGSLPAGLSAAGLALFIAMPRLARTRQVSQLRLLRPILTRTATWVADTEGVAFTPNWRLLGAVAYLVLDIGVLWACLLAVGTAAPVAAIVVGYQIGYLANLVPIPGGIGVLDGGLLGALVLYGLPPAQTAAAVVLYHAIALWLPTLGGTLGFLRLRAAVTPGALPSTVGDRREPLTDEPAADSPAPADPADWDSRPQDALLPSANRHARRAPSLGMTSESAGPGVNRATS